MGCTRTATGWERGKLCPAVRPAPRLLGPPDDEDEPARADGPAPADLDAIEEEAAPPRRRWNDRFVSRPEKPGTGPADGRDAPTPTRAPRPVADVVAPRVTGDAWRTF